MIFGNVVSISNKNENFFVWSALFTVDFSSTLEACKNFACFLVDATVESSNVLEFCRNNDFVNTLISFAWYIVNKKITVTMQPAIYGWHFGQYDFFVSEIKKHIVWI